MLKDSVDMKYKLNDIEKERRIIMKKNQRNKKDGILEKYSLAQMLKHLSNEDLELTRNYYIHSKGTYRDYMISSCKDLIMEAIQEEIDFRQRGIINNENTKKRYI